MLTAFSTPEAPDLPDREEDGPPPTPPIHGELMIFMGVCLLIAAMTCNDPFLGFMFGVSGLLVLLVALGFLFD